MLTAGMDLGAKWVKVVLMNNGEIVARVKKLSGFEQEVSASEAMKEALELAETSGADVARIVATGVGRKLAPFAHDTVTEVGSAARGVIERHAATRTVLDVGAEEGRAILITPDGRVRDFAVNEKCAAGAGTFTESMARALEVKVEELGPLSLTSSQAVPMNAQCAVFAESEVVSLLHARTPKQDIARAVHDAIASRIISMARRVSIEPEVTVIGGMSFNVGFIDSLRRALEMKINIPEFADYVSAEGAACIARDKLVGRAAVEVQD